MHIHTPADSAIDADKLIQTDTSNHQIRRRQRDGKLSFRQRYSDPDGPAIVAEPVREFLIAKGTGIPLEVVSIEYEEEDGPAVLFVAIENPGTPLEKFGPRMVIGLNRGVLAPAIQQFRTAPWSDQLKMLGY